MQSLHYNNGSIKLTRERSTMVFRWEADEVARWISGLAGIKFSVSEIFRKNNIDGIALSLLLREDFQRMGITQLDQQLILIQSIDRLLTLVDHLNSETLSLLFMHIQCAATHCLNLFKQTDSQEKSQVKSNSKSLKSPELYASISHLSNAIVTACHWLGRLPFIECVEYIDLRRKIIKYLVQIRVLLRNLRLGDQTNMAKSKLILETKELRTTAQTLIRQNKDSLFSSDRYLTRVHLRRPITDDVNIEYTTMPDFTHVISSIETEAIGYMGSGFSAINIGDEIIEINNQVVIGWDPVHFNELLRSSTQTNEICLLVKKMPRHKDDEIYTKCLSDGPNNSRRLGARGLFERKQQQNKDNRTRLLEQEGEIEIESDDETLYQSKRSSLKKPDQHSSLPDLTEPSPKSSMAYDQNQTPDFVSRPIISETKSNHTEQTLLSVSPPVPTPRSLRKAGFESYISTLLRSRQDTKSIIPDHEESNLKDHPQLVNVKRIGSIVKRPSSSSNMSTSSHDDPTATPIECSKEISFNKSQSQTSLQMSPSPLSSLSNLFKSESSEKNRAKRSLAEQQKYSTFVHDRRHDQDCQSISSQSSVANKPPMSQFESSFTLRRANREKRSPSYRRISCKDLGKGDCEGFLKRYSSKGTISYFAWRSCWCVLKGGVLYIFKSQDEKNQEIEIKLEGKNISPAPEKSKYAFCIVDDNNKTREYFCCSSRDEMAKWMNKMGLAAINFDIDDSKIAGFNKGFVDSLEISPASTPRTLKKTIFGGTKKRCLPINSAGDSENESDKEWTNSWTQSISQNSSIFDMDTCKEKNANGSEKVLKTPLHIRSSSSTSILSLPETATNKPHVNLSTQKFPAASKGHHRTCSSPIRFLSTYHEQQENIYVQVATKCYDSDSSNEYPHQRTFVNSEVLKEEQIRPTEKAHPSLMLNSSGGFTTPTARSSSASSAQTTSFSPPPDISPSHRPSNNSVFLIDDEELSSLSSPIDNKTRLSSVESSHIPISKGFISATTHAIPMSMSPSQLDISNVNNKSADENEFFFRRRSPLSFEKESPTQLPDKLQTEQDNDISPSSSVF